MKIGIVGEGVVGSACKFGFEKLGHEVKVHDTKYNNTLRETKFSDLFDCEVIYLCVPTPSLPTGECDTSIVENYVQLLDDYIIGNVFSAKFNSSFTDMRDAKYKFPILAIKSTVTPKTTQRLIQRYGHNLNICFVPEFLRERCAISDFIENHDLLAVGTHDEVVFKAVVKSHGSYPEEIVQLAPTEAEFLKYYSNAFNAMRIVFANEMSVLCHRTGANYKRVKDAYIKRKMVPDIYLDVNENWRGYGGMCLPKDVKALAWLAKELDTDMKLFETIDRENEKFKITVPKGMRK